MASIHEVTSKMRRAYGRLHEHEVGMAVYHEAVAGRAGEGAVCAA